MRVRMLFLLFPIAVFPFVVHGQQSSSSLTDTQQLGRQVFEQRCAVCHTRPTLAIKKPWGPVPTKDFVEMNEELARQAILKGRPGSMPGFQYGLDDSEVDAIIEYLKTGPNLIATGDKNRDRQQQNE